MFQPKIVITNELLRSLINLEVSLALIDNLVVSDEWKGRLKTDSLVRRVGAMEKFWDSNLKQDDLLKIVRDDPNRDEKTEDLALRLSIVGKEYEVQMVTNWINANKYVEQIVYLSLKFKQKDYGEKDLIQINKLLGERMVEALDLGAFRKQSLIENSIIRHPEVVEIAYQLEEMMLWIKSTDKQVIHPILRGLYAFAELIRVRPFLHQNFITMSLFLVLLIETEGISFVYCPLEEELFKNKQKLFELLAKVDSEESGLTVFLEEMVKLMAVAAEKTRIRIVSLMGDSVKYKSESGKAVALSERQVSLMEELTMRGQMTIKELRLVLPLVSDDTILRDLKDLVAKKMIKKKGKTKGAVYVVGKVNSFR